MSQSFCNLDGKAALVTGGARGIGAAISRELAAAGARVGVNYRAGHETAESLAAEIDG
ncbi:MAG: SDR family NAD(P)-dependent oxidoreductase, partial [Gaiellaceae bacterium]